MANDWTGFDEQSSDRLRADLVDRIARSARGRYTVKIRSLMEMFGYKASQRVRQSSLQDVVTQLAGWGIDHKFPGGISVSDWITLSLRDEPMDVVRAPAAAQPGGETFQPSGDEGNGDDLIVNRHSNPFAFVFDVADVRDRERSVSVCHDIFAAIWAYRPVCLHIEASDEMFAFAAGFVGSILRRRALMVRRTSWYSPAAPEVLTLHDLKVLLKQAERRVIEDHFPTSGAVYLVRDIPDDVQDDELIAVIREMYVPHTYRLKARFSTTTGDVGPGDRRAREAEGFDDVVRWIGAFAGALSVAEGAAVNEFVDLPSMMAEAAQISDVLAADAMKRETEQEFRAGFESSEHMVLKGSLLRFLRRRHPGERIAVETTVDLREVEDAVGDPYRDDLDSLPGDRPSRDSASRERARPDLHMGMTLAVEIETLRSLTIPGSSAFFNLESKLRKKLAVLDQFDEVWIVVPSDVATLATEELSAMVRSLRSTASKARLRMAFVDLLEDRPVFIRQEPRRRHDVRLVGASWRESRKQAPAERLTWKDVAGFSDLKQRITRDVLAPLRDPDKYGRYGVSAPNGLLLYGLPGCGKSRIGRVLAGEADLACRLVAPSDLTSMWLGEGVMKIRELFDWAIKQAPCLVVIDEIDGLAPRRSEANMHTNEKRQVNELLVQLDRVADKRVAIVATTNYASGIDGAIRRSGRFDVKLPVFPPTSSDRREIFAYYLDPGRRPGVDGLADIDTNTLAERTPLYAPADIKAVVESALRGAIYRAAGDEAPRLSAHDLLEVIGGHQRSIEVDAAVQWIQEARVELGAANEGLRLLEEDVARVRHAQR